MPLFGLVGYPLTHSFSKKYFTEKFEREGRAATHRYELFELPDPAAFPDLLARHPDLVGLNVTIPHKQALFGYLDSLDASAENVGAVNVIRLFPDGSRRGYNSDYYGFRSSLESWEAFQNTVRPQALVLGNGGAARAVRVVLTDLGVPFLTVTRRPGEGDLTYAELSAELLREQCLVINTTPLGTYPDIDTAPALPYEALTPQHLLYDLVYNPAETLFLRRGTQRGAATLNGLPMLIGQAEKSWEIWGGRGV
jgi:shikimate dehydrogenase